MKQLSAIDAAFLYMETPNVHQHVGSLTIYDPSTAPGGKVRFKDIIENYCHRFAQIPEFCSKLVNVPLNLDHPYLVPDVHFDPEFHIRHLALPEPGDWRQLCIMVARLNARPLDRDRPLWETYVIEGLNRVDGIPKGSYAIFIKIHHAIVDGASVGEVGNVINDLTPDYKARPKPDVEKELIDKNPGPLNLFVRANINNLMMPLNLVSVLRNTVPKIADTLARKRRGELRVGFKVPRTRFNSSISPYRSFEAAEFTLQDIKEIKSSLPGATVNDVAITICGGALNKYLGHHGELPEESMAAMVPLNVRTNDEKSEIGNIVSMMVMQVHSNIDDPRERLNAVREGSLGAKEMSEAIGARAMTDYSQFMPGALTAQAARLVSSWGLANHIKPAFNCVITNIPGPQVPVYNTGAKLVGVYGTGPVTDGCGLMFMITSYCGQFVISIISCRELVPDPEFLKKCIVESFDELLAAANEFG